MAEQKWYQRYAEGVVIAIIALPAIAAVSYLYNAASPMAQPLFYGLLAGAAVIVAGMGICILSRMPAKRTIPTTRNIEQCVHTWLHAHNIAVKNDPGEDLLFRFRITLDSEKQMTVVRGKTKFPEYVEIIADVGIRGADLCLLDQFTPEEIEEIRIEVGLELARAKLGYAGLAMPPEHFFLFRRLPIVPALTEHIFMATIYDVEAGINLVGWTFAKGKRKADQRLGNQTPLNLLSTSDDPKPEPEPLPPA